MSHTHSIEKTTLVILLGIVYLALSACATSMKAPEIRTPGTVVDDAFIQQRAAKLLKEELHHEKDERIRVTVYKGIVLLTGQITTEERKLTATEVVENIEHVRAVQNELTTDDFRGVVERARDSYLASTVRAKLLTAEDVDFDKFNIVIDRGNAYLMGYATVEEADRATEIIRNVRGVKAVIKVMEYVEQN
ncbi:MAG: BON domain-containing protein [Gammaproteobacteria bacterium]|nr:BON domain-containing protein [Gammaproteobacteria bacterium]MYF38800.1 BON domain-containing protein [Gammaproteobacteria bacterium]